MTAKTALITGAGQGMGRAIALKFAAADIHTVLVGRTESKLQSVAEEVRAMGGSATIQVVDLKDDEAVAQLGVALQGTTVDMLINCAGDWLIEYLQDTSKRATRPYPGY